MYMTTLQSSLISWLRKLGPSDTDVLAKACNERVCTVAASLNSLSTRPEEPVRNERKHNAVYTTWYINDKDTAMSHNLPQFTVYQNRLIAHILAQPKGSARTDQLARATGTNPSDVSASLLHLRGDGLIASGNDGGAYNYWSATDKLKALLESRRLADACVTVPKAEKYILWSPQSSQPQVQYNSLAEADNVAELMAKKHSGQQFYVCKLVSVCSEKTQIVRNTTVVKEAV